jgi:hypothetical protein
MNLIGVRSRFAVGYELDGNYGGAWMYGKFCYFCNDQEVGDYELGTSLRDVLFQLDEVAKFNHQASPHFSAMSAREIFEMLDTALSGEAIARVAKLAEEEQWREFCIFPSVDIFDKWKGFLLGSGENERLIFSSAPYADVKELELDGGEVESVLKQVRKELNEIYERESE